MSPHTKIPQRLIIPYGTARVSRANVARVPKAEIDTVAGVPLRLGTGPYGRSLVAEEAFDASDDDEMSAGAARLDTLRRLHLRNCDVFDKYLRLWIDLYFDFVAAQALAYRRELSALSRTPDAALDPLLWAMAALRPLPRAHIPAADDTIRRATETLLPMAHAHDVAVIKIATSRPVSSIQVSIMMASVGAAGWLR